MGGIPDRAGRDAVSDVDRFIQVTPPGSACSIAFGNGISDMAAASMRALQVVVASADEALADLRGRGVEVSAVDDQPWGRFVYFADQDGNTWSVQELPDHSQLGERQGDAGVTDNRS